MSNGHEVARRPRVLIAADHLPTRVGLRLALEREMVCTEAATGEAAVSAAIRDLPDVCVLDFGQPAHRIRAVGEIAAGAPAAAMIVLTPRVDEEELVAVLRAGARGYLPEGLDPERLPHVVRSVMRGEAAVPRRLVARLLDELRGDGSRRRVGRDGVRLTPREAEVADLLVQGHTTREIARRLRISQVTVRRHASSMQQKLGVRSRGELVRVLG